MIGTCMMRFFLERWKGNSYMIYFLYLSAGEYDNGMRIRNIFLVTLRQAANS